MMKKREHLLWISVLSAALLCILIIPLNLFFLQMPEWISVLSACAAGGAVFCLWFKLRGRFFLKTTLSVFSLLAMVTGLFGSYCNPYWNSVLFQRNYGYTKAYDTVLTYRQAKRDLDYAFKYLSKLHPAFYTEPPRELETQYEQAVRRLQEAERIDVTLLAAEVEGIFSLLHDAHTDIALNYENPHYMKYIGVHNREGDILTAVNGMPIREMLTRYSDKISYETDTWGVRRLCNYVSTREGLAYLGISAENGVRYTYQTKNGDFTERYAAASDFLTWEEYAAYHSITEDAGQNRFVSFEIDEEHNLAVLTLTSCENNDEYRQCLQELFTEVKRQGIRNIAVDLRNNGGGNSSVATEFLKYIDVDSYWQWGDTWRLGCFLLRNEQHRIRNPKYKDLLFDGSLSVLTSVSTFSSAMNFAEYVKDNGIGMIIGEASGNAPDGYGDISAFILPESGIFMQISTKKWERIDGKKGLIEPDIPCEADAVWEALYAQCNH